MVTKQYKRRELVSVSLRGLAGLAALPLVKACSSGPELVCSDPSTLSRGELNLRKSLNYVELGPEPENQCRQCAFYTGIEAGQCGQCQIFNGAVSPQGYCQSWAQKS